MPGRSTHISRNQFFDAESAKRRASKRLLGPPWLWMTSGPCGSPTSKYVRVRPSWVVTDFVTPMSWCMSRPNQLTLLPCVRRRRGGAAVNGVTRVSSEKKKTLSKARMWPTRTANARRQRTLPGWRDLSGKGLSGVRQIGRSFELHPAACRRLACVPALQKQTHAEENRKVKHQPHKVIRHCQLEVVWTFC